MMKNIKVILTVLALILLASSVSAAWREPTATPPGDNTAEPVNISSTAQAKTGLLGLGGLLLNLVGNLSFGTPAPAGQFLTTDSTGRSIWATPAGGGGGTGDSFWGGSLTDAIYSRNTGLVGIGTQTPNSKLTVTGGDVNITSPGRGLISTVAGDTNWASFIPRHQTTGNMVLTPATAGGQQRDVVINGGKLCLGTDCRATWPAGGGSTPEPDRFGGMYSQTIANLTCPAPNPYTGGCSCPSGYTSRSIVAVGGGYSPIFDLPYMTYYCYYTGGLHL